MSSKTDLMYEITYNSQFVPRRSPRVNIKELIVDGKETYIMKNHLTGMYYDVDQVSYAIWNLIDGQRTLAEISKEVLEKWPDIEPDTAEQVILFLAEIGCLESVVEDTRKKRIKVPSAFEIDVVLIEKSKAFLESIHNVFRPLLKTPLFWGIVVFIILCSIAFAGRFTAIFADGSNFRILGSTVVGFFFYSFIVLGPTIAIHEIAHGLALVHYGGTPGEIGTGLFYFGPMFYIDATDSWILGRRERIMVMMAGNLSTLIIASSIVAIGYIFPYPASVSHLLYMTAFFCFYATLMNMAPPFETDGYYVLADLVNISNLRQESYGYVKSIFKKALRMHTDENAFTSKKKKILIGFAFLSVAWIIYTAFQTTLFTFYMAGDAQDAFITVYSALASSEVLNLAPVVVSIASVLYFGMTLTGYGVILISAIKKAFKAPLKFEAVHDRDLSMFFYLPSKATETTRHFEDQVKKVSKQFTQNYEVTQAGSVLAATLRMGGTKLALNQISTHLRKVEQSFSSTYQSFLQKNEGTIFESAEDSSSKVELASLLRKMGNEAAEARMPEAKNAVEQIIDRQRKTSMHLINSAYGSVWTIELPPFLLEEVNDTLYPSFFVQDFAITDLYGETEEFKKSTIYGFDSLSQLSSRNRTHLQKVLRNPEQYQVVSFFEPIKSRLLFVGRTERIEKDIHKFGTLFIGQAWCGYLDKLLNEANLTLSALRQLPLLNMDDVEVMSDGEIFVLNQNLSAISTFEKAVIKALDESEDFAKDVEDNVKMFKTYFEEDKSLKIGLLDEIVAINRENLARLPRRLKKFRKEFQRIASSIGAIIVRVQEESRKREQAVKKKSRRNLYAYPIVAILSAVLVLAGFYDRTMLLMISFTIVAALLQVSYWAVFYSRWKRFHRAGQYPSQPFTKVQLFTLAFTQAIYRFIATYDVIIPTKERF